MDNLQKKVAIMLFFFLTAAAVIVACCVVEALTVGHDAAQVAPIIISIIEAIGLIVSLGIAVHQLTDSKEIARATFITEINRAFVENEHYMKLYDAFQDCLDGKCRFCENGTCQRDNSSICQLDFPKSDVSNYLTFFETIYLLTKDHVIDFDMIDDLFAYRFFLAVHHPFVQQTKLQVQPQNFKNIFLLERDWISYRKAHGKNMAGIYSHRRLNTISLSENINYDALIG